MKNITSISIIVIVTIFLVFFGISQYGQKKKSGKNFYMTQVTKPSGVLIMGGDRDKIEPFKKDLENNDYIDRYWDHLHQSTAYEKEGKLELAIAELEKALTIIKNGLEAHWTLAELYEKNGKYDKSIKEYDWVIACQEEILKKFVVEKAKFAITQKEKLLQDLRASRARVEELKRKSETGD